MNTKQRKAHKKALAFELKNGADIRRAQDRARAEEMKIDRAFDQLWIELKAEFTAYLNWRKQVPTTSADPW